MNDDLQKLIALQEIDSIVDDLRRQEEDVRTSLAEEEAGVAACERKVEEAKARGLECAKLVREMENDVRELEEKMEKRRGQLNEVKSNREYAALQIEISNDQDKKDRKEEQMLMELEKSDGVGEAVRAEEDELGGSRQVLKVKEEEQRKMVEAVRERMKDEEAGRGNAVANLKKTLADRYDQTRRSRGGIALAEIKGGSCQGCHISLPPQLVIEVRKGEEILDCCSCGRILYVKDDA